MNIQFVVQGLYHKTDIRDRQRAGIDAAKGKGVYKGRHKRVDDAEIRRLASNGVAKAQIARDLKISRMSVYRALNEAAQKQHRSQMF